jgi:proteasome lid subunit RPN8/RPN11
VAHVREGLPNEVCGLLAGRRGVVSRVIRCRNDHETPRTRYRIATADLLHVPRLEDAGEELLAIYHSHPETEARPSPTDVRESQFIDDNGAVRPLYPDSLYVLLSLQGGNPELRAYAIDAGVVREVPVQLNARP